MLSMEIRTGLEPAIELVGIFKGGNKSDPFTPIRTATLMIVPNLNARLVMPTPRRYWSSEVIPT